MVRGVFGALLAVFELVIQQNNRMSTTSASVLSRSHRPWPTCILNGLGLSSQSPLVDATLRIEDLYIAHSLGKSKLIRMSAASKILAIFEMWNKHGLEDL